MLDWLSCTPNDFAQLTRVHSEDGEELDPSPGTADTSRESMSPLRRWYPETDFPPYQRVPEF